MPVSAWEIPAAWLLNLALLTARMTALTVFSPLPGAAAAPPQTRVALALLLAALLAPSARFGLGPAELAAPAAVWLVGRAALAELVLGAGLGLALRLLLEAFSLAAQTLGFQAGYSYVNMVDPTTQVDASILNVALALLANLLFFAFDLHLHLIRILAESLTAHPLGTFATQPGDANAFIVLGAMMFDSAVRLALPVVALLLLVDLTLGLLNQAQPRMQLLTLAFPMKIVAGVAALYPVLPQSPRVFYQLAERSFELLTALLGR
ncbi:MAG: hypothetical protein GC160_28785 [Acidobacteria bacterium]|nr:hypothetical protein [Acidobacteriota bacterium]